MDKISFSTRTSLNLISSPFFDRKQIKKKIAYFDQKVNPFGKMRFLGLEKNFFGIAKKSFFVLYKVIKHYF